MADFIRLAAEYGFDAVDAGGGELKELVSAHGEQGARAWLQETGQGKVRIGSIGLSVEWRGDEAKFRQGLAGLAAEAQAAAALGCTASCTYILPSTDLPAAHFAVLATRRLRTCAQVLGAYGIRLGLEFVGPHHLRTRWANPFLWTPQETLDWIDAIGEPNVGLLYDAYHWYTNELTADDIRKLRPEQIVHVHINDAPDVPVAEALDNGRLYPSEGVIDLAGFLRALHDIGYQGVVAQEILTQAPPQESPEALAQRSQAAFERVYAAAGL
ncbi:sugar phosphate isomerase/epimerase family protein [Gordoniibacillus kamchatkensis]|uniref:sugar phosphate isomerase/epimerase family protein n=1 Tax=Gordoniibacillus kamchatkensis TaxID=1590651 RepID=UPI00069883D1|nr:sugar phosphate isomerase/epimerase family protein [Paenibacillus sp. VKM B-2647]